MNTAELLVEAFERVRGVVYGVVAGLTPDQLSFRVDPDANTIAWLVWHLTRIQDDHVAGVAGTEQVWIAAGWCERFGLPFHAHATGFGHSSEDVAAVRVGSGDLLVDYYDATHDASERFVRTVTDADLDRIVDERWDPPVTLGVRLVSVIEDDLQHAGQAAYVRGVLERA